MLLLWTTLAGLTLFLSGCGVLTTYAAAQKYAQVKEKKLAEERDKKDAAVFIDRAPLKLCAGTAQLQSNCSRSQDEIDQKIAAATTRTELEHEFAMMSVFSRMVYHRHVPENLRYGREPDEANMPPKQIACVKNRTEYPHPVNSLYSNDASPSTKWRLWDDLSGCISSGGLFYETYIYGNEIAVIAFRGTENSTNQIGLDWWGNISNFFGFEPNQYQEARRHQAETIAALIKLNPSIRIYTTGHSLGGGLAQQAAYLHNEVLAAYVFNTSPVTNWSNIYLKKDANGYDVVKNEDPTIYRIELRGEFLDYARWLTTRLSDRRFGRYDYVFQYQAGSVIGRHHMSILTCHFLSSVADHYNSQKPPEFNLTKSMAVNLLADKAESSGLTESFCPSNIYKP